MYEECGYYDPIHGSVDDSSSQPPTTYHNPNCNMNTTDQLEDMNTCRAGSTFSLEDLSHPNMNPPPDDGMDHIQHQLEFNIAMESGNWDPTMIHQQNMQCYDAGSGLYANPPFPPPPDLLNLLHLPQCSVAPPSVFPSASSNISFRAAPGYNPMEMFGDDGGGATIYDPSLQLGYPPMVAAQQHQQQGYGLRDLFGSLPQNYGLFCGGVEEREGGGMMDGMGQCRREAGVGLGKGGGGGGGGEVKEGIYVTERQRREQLKLKYAALRSLIPNPTKGDRASIVADAIEYIKELRRTLEELSLLVEKKKRDRRMMKAEDDESVAANTDSLPIRSVKEELDHSHNGALRSSWLQRKSKDSFVDVRIIDDEVNIKITQKRKASSCLLYVAKALDELQLDLAHVTGGNMADHYIFMLNAKICEGSSVYAGDIAKKLLDVMERQYQALELHDSF